MSEELEKEVKPYEKNAKKHPNKQLLQIAKSIKEFGWQQPIVVDKEGIIIVGHGRWFAFEKYGKELKMDEPRVEVADNLTEEQVNAYRLADNKLNESDWDMGLAIDELRELSPEMFDLTGFDQDLLIEPDEKDDEIPENPPSVAQLGDVWILGNHRVMCGDSTKKEDVEKLMDGKKAQFFMADPPYNVEYTGGSTNKKERVDSYADKKSEKDYTEWLVLILQNGFNFTDEKAPLHLWFAGSKIKSVVDACYDNHWFIRNLIVWNKLNAHYGALGARYKEKKEPMLYCSKEGKSSRWYGKTNETTVWDEVQASKNELHPTMKPVSLYVKSILNHIQKEDIVYEAFLGSGTTLIAAEKTGRICYGMELDPKYVDVIIKRYEDYTDNKAVKEKE